MTTVTRSLTATDNDGQLPRGGARTSLGELARLFLKVGTLAFGGPAAHIAMFEEEVVRRRQWMTHAEFLDSLGAANLIPGPNSTELALYIGRAQAGWPGLLVAGACFITPSALLVGILAWGYVRFGALPAVAGVLYGVKPVVIAVVVQALWRLARTALKTRMLVVLGLAAVLMAACGVNALWILFVAGATMALAHSGQRWRLRKDEASGTARVLLMGLPSRVRDAVPSHRGSTEVVSAVAASAVGTSAVVATPFGLWPLFGVFVKVGAVLFGSGYVLIAFLRADLVERLGWLTERQLLDAVAVGQVTPGPVFTTATFIGYLLGGPVGASVATVGIFLPAFVFVALSGLILPRIRRSSIAGAVLDGVNVASLALMAVVTWQLTRSALIDPLTIILAMVSGVLLFRFRMNAAWLVLGGGVLGLTVSGIPGITR